MRFRFEPVPDFIDQFDKLTRKDRALRERAIKKIDQILLWFDHHDQAYDKAASILEKTASDYPYLLRDDYCSKRNDKDR